jgi:hypothetical protein
MVYGKRLIIALIFGLITGLICGFLSLSNTPAELKTMIFSSALLNRILIGFIIGISCWKLGWVLHGLVIGFIVSLFASISVYFSPQGGLWIAVMFIIAGLVWGFIIELFTTVIFKAPMKCAE